MLEKPTIEELLALFHSPFPRIEMRRHLTLLRRDDNVFMVVPPLDRPLALGMFSANLPPQARLDLYLARLRIKGPDRLDGYDLTRLESLLEEAGV
jgi:hypothetical protein